MQADIGDEVVVRPRRIPDDLGAPALPPSKSWAQRLLLLAALRAGDTRLQPWPDGDDAAALARAVAALGAVCRADGDAMAVSGTAAPDAGERPLDLGENGTGLRLLQVAVPILGGRARLEAAPALRRRPLDEGWMLLRAAGARVEVEAWPVLVDGRDVAWPATLEVTARRTTQTASGVLLAQGCRVLRGDLPEAGAVVQLAEGAGAEGYLDVTCAALGRSGLAVDSRRSGRSLRVTLARRAPPPASQQVPVDASAAAFPLALAAMHGHAWTPPAGSDPQPDWALGDDLRALAGAGDVTLAHLGQRPDTFPALCAVAAWRWRGRTVLAGAPALRHKESDRVAAMAAGLAAAGARVRERPDGLVVEAPIAAADRTARGDPLPLPTVADHRVVMALALLGTGLARGVRLQHAGAVAKSWPGYWSWLRAVAEVT